MEILKVILFVGELVVILGVGVGFRGLVVFWLVDVDWFVGFFLVGGFGLLK